MVQSESPAHKGQARDEQILRALSLKVRVFSLQQIATAWWPDSQSPIADASRRLAKLVKRGLLERDEVNSHAMLPLQHPLLVWNPGQPDPDFAPIADEVEARRRLAFRTVTVFLATQFAAAQRGGFGGGLTEREHVTHDLHVAELYLRLARDYPALAEAWVGEEARKADGLELYEKLPDAVLYDATGASRLAIEFVGRYPLERIVEFHEHCKSRRLPYQLW